MAGKKKEASSSEQNPLIDPLFIMVSLGGLEPPTHSLEGCCSIQLSYRPIIGMAVKIDRHYGWSG